MKKLCLGPDFTVPAIEGQTNSWVVYGGKGMGKTNFGGVLVEELAKHGLRFSVLDPLDVWWGLQHGATRDTPGLNVVILGGPHGDIPIDPSSGAVVADFVADEEVSTVVVLRGPTGEMWSAGERIRFATDYASRLYMRQGERRIPLMQVIDEAGRFVPQMAGRGDLEIAKCIGAIETLTEWGRNVGVGVCLITQRSARMNKSVSELADCMVAFRTVGPNSIAAIVDWFGEHVPKPEQKGLIEQLRALDRGTALVVSPGWLKFEGAAKVRIRETFDSSATPQPGKSLRAPGAARKPDLALYTERMKETAERAKADDPRELRRQIAALKKDLAAKPKPAPPAPRERKAREIYVLKDAQVKRLERQVEALKVRADQLQAQGRDLHATASEIAGNLRAAVAKPIDLSPAFSSPAAAPRPAPAVRATAPRRSLEGNGGADINLGKGELTILRAVAQHGIFGANRQQLTVLTGYRRSTRDTYLQRLSLSGLVYQDGENLYATADGTGRLGPDFEPLPTGDELRAHWMQKLPEGEKKILAILIDGYPEPVDRDLVSEKTGYARSSRDTYIQRLSSRRLVDQVGRGAVRASEILFS